MPDARPDSPDALLRDLWGPWRADWRRRWRALASSRGPDSARFLDELRRAVDDTRRRADALPRPAFANTLPVTERRDEIAKAIADHQVVVLCGETGSGKTTQLPQICLAAGRGRTGLIGHTQPRRIAARTVAARIADELGEPLGQSVGFKVRFGDQTSQRTVIKIMTDGILLAETQGDRALESYDTIIVDEAHERSLNVDFLLGYLRQLLPRRPDLKVIITSATIDPERFANHFATTRGPAPILTVSGRTYPVEVRYRPIQGDGEEGDERDVDLAILDAVDELTTGDGGKGDVLVFLPGEREIREAAEELRKHHPPGTEILPLYARLSPQDQMKAFAPHRARRIVLATNVAETSLTVPGIRYVVDAGVARISRYAPRSKVQRLPIEKVSQASANQRAGRCGRVQSGVCIRLYSEDDFKARPPFTEPEILRTNLASVILQMKALRLGPIEEFPFVEPPDARMIKDGYETLLELGAVDEAGELTRLGAELARLPIDPRVGRMLLAARDEHCVAEALVIVSALSAQDPRDRPPAAQDQADQAHRLFSDPESDFLTYLHLWRQYQEQSRHLSSSKIRNWCRERFVSYVRMREWEDVHHQLKALAGEIGLPLRETPAEPDAVHRAVLAGLLSNIGAKGDSFEYQGARGRKFNIFPGSALFKKNPKWVAAAEIVETTRVYARTVCKIQPEWAERIGSHVVKRAYSDAHWSEEAGQVGAFERVSLFGLTLVPRRRVHYGPIDPAASRTIFIRKAIVEGLHGGRLDRAPFLAHNRALIEQVRHAEAKLRRADILVDEETLAAWYEARIPAGIHGVGAFDQWRRQAEARDPRILFMSTGDVARRDPAEISADAFPDLMEVCGEALVLDYRLNPGEDDDGVTLELPIGLLPRLDPARCDWLVPGMLKEKILGLLRALPKSIRSTLDPVQALADRAAAEIVFGSGNLFDALTALVERERGVRVERRSWQPQALPLHLHMRIRIIDEEGRQLATGRDAAELQARLAARARKTLAALARKTFGREGMTQWDFDAIPARPEGGGFPALMDNGQTVALTLLDSQESADAATHHGVRRFFVLAARQELDYHIGRQPALPKMRMMHAPLGSGDDLLDGLRCIVAERVFMQGLPPITMREAFEARLAERWGRIGLASREAAALVEGLLQQRQTIALRLAKPFPDYCQESAADLKEQLALLAPPGFLRTTPEERLRDMPRYFEAMILRARKLDNGNWKRDEAGVNALRPLWRRCMQTLAASESQQLAAPPGVREHRWLLEELRVSLFAERLGTSVPVSVKRLNDHWAGLGLPPVSG